ncbi:MAG: hypothetical protein C0403_19560, partial [Desulfobacterium sp.]|nr:hypothetical protein [Desulfobacterium sp.]
LASFLDSLSETTRVCSTVNTFSDAYNDDRKKKKQIIQTAEILYIGQSIIVIEIDLLCVSYLKRFLKSKPEVNKIEICQKTSSDRN